MCIKNGILRVLFSGHSFIDFQGVALSASPRENQPLPDVGFERVKGAKGGGPPKKISIFFYQKLPNYYISKVRKRIIMFCMQNSA